MSPTNARSAVEPTDSDIEQFRMRVRAALGARYALRDPEADDDRVDVLCRAPDGHHVLVNASIELQALLREAGLLALTLPVDYGGQGLHRRYQEVLDQETTRYDTPTTRSLGIGPGLAFPTIQHNGSEDQKRRFLPGIAKGQHRWCQLFSEPDAGSDLVSLRTTAVRDGDAWVVNGQKVWTSYADGADLGLLLARTDPGAERPHNGITMFIVAMDTAGVAVRPLIDMAGGRHFNEVFLSDVHIGSDMVIGEVNRGWQIANGTLGGERAGYLGGSGNGRRRRQVTRMAQLHGRRADPVTRQRIVDITINERTLEWLRDRIVGGQVAGGNAASGSLIKLAAGNLEQAVGAVLVDLAGPVAMAWRAGDRNGDIAAHTLCSARQASISGGTHQIQRNLVAERLLGLPRT
jgi:alkylation response protein AidB-like acyl-CoA dehydrogenase